MSEDLHEHSHSEDGENKIKKHWPAYLMCLLVAIIFLISTFTFQASETKHTLVTRFGKIIDVYQPGLHFKLPYPIEQVRTLEKRKIYFETPLSQNSLSDAKTVMVSSYALWSIKKPKEFLKVISTVENAQKNYLDNIIGTSVANVLSKYKLSDLVNTDPTKIQKNKIKNEVLVEARNAADKYGIEILIFGIKQQVLPPGSLTAAVTNRMRSERKKLASQYKNEGLKRVAEIIGKATRQARSLVKNAESEAEKIKGEGEAEAAKHYSIFKEQPELASFLLALESLKKIIGENDTLVIDTKVWPFNLLKADALKKFK